jgi:hypothetical protein
VKGEELMCENNAARCATKQMALRSALLQLIRLLSRSLALITGLQSAARELICTESAYSQTDDAPYAAEKTSVGRSSRCQFVYSQRSQHAVL